MSLSGKQRRFLRAEAHALEPVVSLGKEGITPSLIGAVNEALLTHELIKVRVLEGAPLERKEVAETLPDEVKAELVGLIGRVVILYKRHPNKPKLRLPREPKAGPGTDPAPDRDDDVNDA
jgi:RNA-binding protein